MVNIDDEFDTRLGKSIEPVSDLNPSEASEQTLEPHSSKRSYPLAERNKSKSIVPFSPPDPLAKIEDSLPDFVREVVVILNDKERIVNSILSRLAAIEFEFRFKKDQNLIDLSERYKRHIDGQKTMNDFVVKSIHKSWASYSGIYSHYQKIFNQIKSFKEKDFQFEEINKILSENGFNDFLSAFNSVSEYIADFKSQSEKYVKNISEALGIAKEFNEIKHMLETHDFFNEEEINLSLTFLSNLINAKNTIAGENENIINYLNKFRDSSINAFKPVINKIREEEKLAKRWDEIKIKLHEMHEIEEHSQLLMHKFNAAKNNISKIINLSNEFVSHFRGSDKDPGNEKYYLKNKEQNIILSAKELHSAIDELIVLLSELKEMDKLKLSQFSQLNDRLLFNYNGFKERLAIFHNNVFELLSEIKKSSVSSIKDHSLNEDIQIGKRIVEVFKRFNSINKYFVVGKENKFITKEMLLLKSAILYYFHDFNENNTLKDFKAFLESKIDKENGLKKDTGEIKKYYINITHSIAYLHIIKKEIEGISNKLNEEFSNDIRSAVAGLQKIRDFNANLPQMKQFIESKYKELDSSLADLEKYISQSLDVLNEIKQRITLFASESYIQEIYAAFLKFI